MIIPLSDLTKTSIYADVSAIILLLGLLLLTNRLRKRAGFGEKLFSKLTQISVVYAVFDIIYMIIRSGDLGQVNGVLAMTAVTVVEFVTLVLIYTWLLYVDFMLYQSEDHVLRHYKMLAIPFFVLAVVLFLNCFFQFMIELDPDEIYDFTGPYFVYIAFEYAFLIVSIVMIIRYKKNNGSMHYTNFVPMGIPVLVGALVSNTTPYSAFALGLAIGLVFLHFSFMEEACYKNEEKGYFHKEYFERLIEHTKNGEYDPRGAIYFKAEGNREAFEEILLEWIPDDSELLKIHDGSYLFVNEHGRSRITDMLITDISEDTEKYKDGPISLENELIVRNENESGVEFLNRLMEETDRR